MACWCGRSRFPEPPFAALRSIASASKLETVRVCNHGCAVQSAERREPPEGAHLGGVSHWISSQSSDHTIGKGSRCNIPTDDVKGCYDPTVTTHVAHYPTIPITTTRPHAQGITNPTLPPRPRMPVTGQSECAAPKSEPLIRRPYPTLVGPSRLQLAGSRSVIAVGEGQPRHHQPRPESGPERGGRRELTINQGTHR